MDTYKILLYPSFLLVLFFSGCATRPTTERESQTLYLQAVERESQTLTYQDGKQWLVSRKAFYNVGIYPVSDIIEPNQPGMFYVAIYNKNNDALNFSTDNINAYCGKMNVKVYTYNESLKYEIDKTSRKGLSASDLAGLTPAQINSVMALTPPPGPRYEKLRLDILKKYASALLKRNTVSPNSQYGGIFQIGFPAYGDVLTIEVINPKESHQFRFNIQKR